jgi:acetyl esterase/lipase
VKNRWYYVLIAVLWVLAATAIAQPHPDLNTEPITERLWSAAAPGGTGDTPEDVPTITLFRPFISDPAKATRTAVIVAPGGAYLFLADNHEGRQVANWLNSLGVTVFVLKYRVGPKYRYPVELEDMQRAIRVVRNRAAEFGIAPDRIGVMGFSAGGHLSALAGTHYTEANPSATDAIDRVSSRPDFMVLGYPLISYIANWSNPAFRDMANRGLLGSKDSLKLRVDISPEMAVTAKTPPAFLFSTSADQALPPQDNAVPFYLALQKNQVPAELHVFQNGPHGVGLDLGDPVLGEWPVLLRNWLAVNGWLSAPGK